MPICDHGPVGLAPRIMLKPDSLDELACQLKLIWLEETAVALRFDGAAGSVTLPLAFLAALAGEAQSTFRIAQETRSGIRTARPACRARGVSALDEVTDVSGLRFILAQILRAQTVAGLSAMPWAGGLHSAPGCLDPWFRAVRPFHRRVNRVFRAESELELTKIGNRRCMQTTNRRQ